MRGGVTQAYKKEFYINQSVCGDVSVLLVMVIIAGVPQTPPPLPAQLSPTTMQPIRLIARTTKIKDASLSDLTLRYINYSSQLKSCF